MIDATWEGSVSLDVEVVVEPARLAAWRVNLYTLYQTVVDASGASWDTSLGVNVKGYACYTKAAISIMRRDRQSEWGRAERKARAVLRVRTALNKPV